MLKDFMIISGWFAVIILIFSAFVRVNSHPGKLELVLMLILLLLTLIIQIVCGFLKGTNGPNKYGQDPLEGKPIKLQWLKQIKLWKTFWGYGLIIILFTGISFGVMHLIVENTNFIKNIAKHGTKDSTNGWIALSTALYFFILIILALSWCSAIWQSAANTAHKIFKYLGIAVSTVITLFVIFMAFFIIPEFAVTGFDLVSHLDEFNICKKQISQSLANIDPNFMQNHCKDIHMCIEKMISKPLDK